MWRDPRRTRLFLFGLLALGVSLCVLPPRILFTGWVSMMFTRYFRKRGGMVTMAARRFIEGLPVETVAEAIYAVSDHSAVASSQQTHLAGGTFARIGDPSWRKRRKRMGSDV